MLQSGVSSYITRAGIGAFLSRPLKVTAVEHLAADYNRLFSWLQCDLTKAVPPLPSTRMEYPGKNDTSLSKMGEVALRQALSHDYATQQSLLTARSSTSSAGPC